MRSRATRVKMKMSKGYGALILYRKEEIVSAQANKRLKVGDDRDVVIPSSKPV